jgi:mRNA interferase MazF
VTRGDLYSSDPKRQRAFAVVSRQILMETRFLSVICAPIYSRHDGLTTQVKIGAAQGLKQESSIHCDELLSLPKTMLTRFIGRLSPDKIQELDQALLVALDLDNYANES